MGAQRSGAGRREHRVLVAATQGAAPATPASLLATTPVRVPHPDSPQVKFFTAMQTEIKAQGHDIWLYLRDPDGAHTWRWGCRMTVQVGGR